MVKQLLFWLSIASYAVGFYQAQAQTQPQGQTLAAFVDRNEITLNDVITLTIRVDDQLGNATPSLSGLNQDFEQLGISRSNSYTNDNGNIQSWSEFRITLKPKSTGTLTIPAFRVGAEVSLPISVMVAVAAQNTTSANQDIFLRTSVSKNTIYVQEQLLYTIKLYYIVGFDQGAQLSSPQVSDAVIQQLGNDQTYQEIIDGIRYNVTEREYVIYPQNSNQLTISPIQFTATVGRRRNGLSRILNNRASSAREINLTSDSHIINVQPVPSSFPGDTWLPTAELTLVESWSTDLGKLTVGEAITRNISVSVAGLSSSLIPAFEYPANPDLKFYPDQAVREDTIDSAGIIGTLAEGTAIVASTVGEFTIPEVTIPWWNTQTDRLEIARIAAKTLTVLPDPSLVNSVNTEPFGAITSIPSSGPSINTSAEPPPMVLASQSSAVGLYWMIATVIFACAWFFTAVLLLRNRQLLNAIQVGSYPSTHANQADTISQAQHSNFRGSPTSSSQAALSLSSAYNALQSNCKQQADLRLIKQSLLLWGQALPGNTNILTLEKLKQVGNNSELSASLDELEKVLYGDEQQRLEFNIDGLLSAVKTIHNDVKKHTKSGEDYSLPPLYKN